ncbi:MAG: Gfo/Idh/MocA family oxidoreductase [bacterium]|nr:Gfo/Idh/MocA family oxidoreductase [bacterium]
MNNIPPSQSETDAREHRGFVVAGLGKMGIMHAAMLGVVPGGKVAGLVDVDAKLGEHVRSMGVEAPAFIDLEACLDAVRPEGVWIATPQFAHRPLFEICLRRRVPVFCEKPLAHALVDARAMAALAAGQPALPVAVGFMLAHNPLFSRAGELIRGGALGAIKSFRASCRLSQVFAPMKGWTFTRDKAGGGVLINSGCHLLFILLEMFGRPRCFTVRGGGVHNEVEDTLGALIDYPNGLWGVMEVTWSVPGHETQTHDVEVIGTGGTLEVGNQWLRVWLARRTSDLPAGWTQWRRAELEPRADFSLSPDYCGDEFYLEDRDFVEAVRKGRPPRVGVAAALAVQEMVDAIYRALESGAPAPMPAEGES